MVTKTQCAQNNGLSGMTYIQIDIDIHYGSNEISIAPNNTVVLLIIRHRMVTVTVVKKQCMRSKYLL